MTTPTTATPRVTVLMTVYNGQTFLDAAIRSVLDQTLTDFELLIVDDGSTDQSTAIAQGHAAEDHRIRLLQPGRLGRTAALNHGIAHAASPCIAILDADDLARPDRLALQLARFEAQPDLALVGGGFQYRTDNDRRLHRIQPPTQPPRMAAALLRYCCIYQTTVMFRRSCVEAVGGYRGFEPAEDYDLWLRLAERYPIANLRAVLSDYRLHDRQLTAGSLEQMVLSALAARRAAVCRRAGQSEPLPTNMQHPTRDDLRAMGVTDEAVGQALLDAVLHQAELMLWLGRADTAAALLDETTWPIDIQRVRQERSADIAWLRMACDRRMGRGSVVQLAPWSLAHPRAAARFLARKAYFHLRR